MRSRAKTVSEIIGLLCRREALGRVTARLLHLAKIIARPRPPVPSGDELMTLPAGEAQRATADAPTGNVPVVLVEVGAGNVSPGENLHNLIWGIAEKPRSNVWPSRRIEEGDAPVALHDVTADSMQFRRSDLLTHPRRIGE